MFEVFEEVFDFGIDDADFGGIGIERGFVEVLIDSFVELCLILKDN